MINWGGTHKDRKENMNLIYAFKVRPVMFYFCEVSLQRSLHFCKVSTQPEHDRLHCTYWGQLLVCLVWFSIKYSVQLAALSLDADQVSTFLSICCLTLSSINTPNCENYVSQLLWSLPSVIFRIIFFGKPQWKPEGSPLQWNLHFVKTLWYLNLPFEAQKYF